MDGSDRNVVGSRCHRSGGCVQKETEIVDLACKDHILKLKLQNMEKVIKDNT